MQYRPLGSSGIDVSVLSFGTMRYLSADNAAAVLTRGMDLGMNYLDTSSGYCGGKSEQWCGAAVRGRRPQMYFSNKSAWSSAPKADDVRANIERQLKASGLDYFDLYQLWGMEKRETLAEALRRGGFVAGVRKAQKEGLVRHGIGFTFHGQPEVFRAAVDCGEFCCATLSYNLMKRDEAPNIAYAAAKGVGTIIMNPLAGGPLGLAGGADLDFLRPPATDGKRPAGTGPWWGALRFLLSDPAITTSLVGATSAKEIEQAVSAMDGASKLGPTFRADLVRKMDAVQFAKGSLCTGCGYCKECPAKFNPTRFMEVMRDFARYRVPQAKLRHWILSKYAHQNIFELIARCIECGQCEQKCPQHLEIVAAIRAGKAALKSR